MSIENGIPTLPHSSGVLCVLKGYAASLRKILKIVQSLVMYYSKARKYVNTADWVPPASLARFPNLANANVYR